MPKVKTLAAKIAGAVESNDVDVVMVATAKAKGNRDNLKPGSYQVDSLVRVKGTLNVGEDCDTLSVQSLNPWLLLRLTMSKLNKTTIEAVVDEFKKLQEAKAEDYAAEDAAAEEIKKTVEVQCKSLLKATKATRKGSVTWHGSVEVEKEQTKTEHVEVSALATPQ